MVGISSKLFGEIVRQKIIICPRRRCGIRMLRTEGGEPFFSSRAEIQEVKKYCKFPCGVSVFLSKMEKNSPTSNTHRVCILSITKCA